MALHTVAFTTGVIDEDTNAVPAVSDGVFGTLNGALIPQQSMRLIATVAGGSEIGVAALNQRSMDITPANIFPLNTFPWPSPVGAMVQRMYGPRVPAGEAISAVAQRSGAAPSNGVVLGWFADRIEPIPEGEHFLLAFEMEAISLTAARWTATGPISLSRIYSLPTARYQVVGMDVYADTGNELVAARLLLPNQVYRPGAIIHTGSVPGEAVLKLPPDFQLDGSLGCWGWFEQGSLPRLEVLGMAAESVSLRGHLRIVRMASGSGGGMGGGIGGASWG